jgi:hypothetical protein
MAGKGKSAIGLIGLAVMGQVRPSGGLHTLRGALPRLHLAAPRAETAPPRRAPARRSPQPPPAAASRPPPSIPHALPPQNLALNIAEKGFPISVYNRSGDKTDACVARAAKEGLHGLRGFKDLSEFVASLERPRRVIILVKAGAPVDQTIEGLLAAGMEKGDIVVDGGNEWCVLGCGGGGGGGAVRGDAGGLGAPESRRSLRFCSFLRLLMFILIFSHPPPALHPPGTRTPSAGRPRSRPRG